MVTYILATLFARNAGDDDRGRGQLHRGRRNDPPARRLADFSAVDAAAIAAIADSAHVSRACVASHAESVSGSVRAGAGAASGSSADVQARLTASSRASDAVAYTFSRAHAPRRTSWPISHGGCGYWEQMLGRPHLLRKTLHRTAASLPPSGPIPMPSYTAAAVPQAAAPSRPTAAPDAPQKRRRSRKLGEAVAGAAAPPRPSLVRKFFPTLGREWRRNLGREVLLRRFVHGR